MVPLLSMKAPTPLAVCILVLAGGLSARGSAAETGPAAAVDFARGYRGEVYTANTLHCWPDAKGVPFADCEHITPMGPNLWTPKQIVADFQRRMANLPASERK